LLSERKKQEADSLGRSRSSSRRRRRRRRNGGGGGKGQS